MLKLVCLFRFCKCDGKHTVKKNPSPIIQRVWWVLFGHCPGKGLVLLTLHWNRSCKMVYAFPRMTFLSSFLLLFFFCSSDFVILIRCLSFSLFVCLNLEQQFMNEMNCLTFKSSVATLEIPSSSWIWSSQLSSLVSKETSQTGSWHLGFEFQRTGVISDVFHITGLSLSHSVCVCVLRVTRLLFFSSNFSSGAASLRSSLIWTTRHRILSSRKVGVHQLPAVICSKDNIVYHLIELIIWIFTSLECFPVWKWVSTRTGPRWWENWAWGCGQRT